MNFLYGMKGCSHCDGRDVCDIELKNSRENLLKEPRIIKEGPETWASYCSDFFRVHKGSPN